MLNLAFDASRTEQPNRLKAKVLARPRIETKKPTRLRDKVNAILEDPSVNCFGNFLDRFYPAMAKTGMPKPQELGILLKFLRHSGKLSPEIDGFMVDQLKDVVFHRLQEDIADDYPLPVQIEKLAKAEFADQEKTRHLLKTYADLARAVRRTQAKLTLGLEVSDSENKQLDNFTAFQFNLIDEIPPATLFRHFMENGDLRWLWDLDAGKTVLELKDENEKTALGGTEAAEW